MSDTTIGGAYTANPTTPLRDDLIPIERTTDTLARAANVNALLSGPSLLVASATATADELRHADYVCDGDDDQVQIQAAIDALPVGGGTVYFTAGTFVLKKTGNRSIDPVLGYCLTVIQADGPVALLGDARATIFQLADSQPADTAILLVQGLVLDKRTSPTLIQGIEFDGNKAGQLASWVDFGLVVGIYADSVTIDNCYLHDAPLWPFHFLRNCQYVRVTNNRQVANDVGNASWIETLLAYVYGNEFICTETGALSGNLIIGCNADVGIPGEYITIQNNIFTGGEVSLNLSGARHCVVTGNIFRNVRNTNGVAVKCEFFNGIVDYDALENIIADNLFHNIRNGVFLTGDVTNGSIRNLVMDNQIIEGPDISLAFGVLQSGAASLANLIQGNQIVGATTPISITAGTATVTENIGYATEKAGATSVADGGTIAHGLAAAPTSVQANPSVSGEMVSITALGATTFTVAIKKHDGSAGTTQTVYWRAWVT